WLDDRVVPDTFNIFVAGVVLTWGGIGFAIWARFTLGSNWSGTVQVKESHTLVISGPYRIVRHPIYTGILVAMLGTALGTGRLRSFLAVPLAFSAWRIKSLHEEGFMLEQFGNEYREYKSKVKALIPGIL